MTIIEIILFAGWIVWLALYFHLVWRNGKAGGLSFSLMFFPIYLFMEGSWPAGTEMSRMKLKVFTLVLLVATAIVAFFGDPNAS